jgi:hypothetical protein
MKIITSKAHGVIDYIVGALFLALPYLAGWDTTSLPSRVFLILGALTVIYSLATRYELGLFRVIPFHVHLIIDLVSGIFLASSPWLLGFSEEVYLPHLVLGLFEILAVLMTVSSKNVHIPSSNQI